MNSEVERQITSTTDVQEACQIGYTAGFDEGYKKGYKEGYAEGHDDGLFETNWSVVQAGSDVIVKINGLSYMATFIGYLNGEMYVRKDNKLYVIPKENCVLAEN